MYNSSDPTGYDYSFNMPNAPININAINAALIGFSVTNTNYFSYSLNLAYSNSNPTSMTLTFNPFFNLKFYSISFSVIATAPPA